MLGAEIAGASQVVLVVKNPPADAGDVGDAGLIPGSGRSSGGECGNPLQYSCLENPMDRGAWQATVHGVAKSRTRLKQLSTGGQSAGETVKWDDKHLCSGGEGGEHLGN